MTEASRQRDFFSLLPPLATFAQAADLNFHTDLPADWWLVITDVVNSTQAIRDGKYKNVNTVGASTIIAVLNTDRSVELPYVFGGDGANLAIPPELEAATRAALLGAQDLARDGFGLTLRIGMVRVADLIAQGHWVKVCKYQQSEHICLAAFSGAGWGAAERLVKEVGGRYEVTATSTIKAAASFEGFECRWQGVGSRFDHKLCLLVASMSGSPAEHAAVYRQVMDQVAAVYGDVMSSHPLALAQLQLSLNPWRLLGEATVRGRNAGFFGVLRYLLVALVANRIGRWLFKHGRDTQSVQWSRYRQDMIRNADTRKFDGMLKMVVDGTEAQYAQLQSYLEDLYRRRLIVYGMHRSSEALITCLIFSYSGKHAHFVDGAGGGYALAAVELKERLAAFKDSAPAAATASSPL